MGWGVGAKIDRFFRGEGEGSNLKGRPNRRSHGDVLDMNVDVFASDGRRIEVVLAQDLPCFSRTQLAIDITLQSPLTSAGEAHPNAADIDGAVLLQARRDKERTYPELTTGRCKLVVLGIETCGPWAEEGVQLLQQLSVAKAREVPTYMARCVSLASEHRWTRFHSLCN